MEVEFISTADQPMPEGVLCIFRDGIGIDCGIRVGDTVKYYNQKASIGSGVTEPVAELSSIGEAECGYQYVDGWFLIG